MSTRDGDSDAGWQQMNELLGKGGSLSTECTIYGTELRVVYHWESVDEGDKELAQIPVIDACFVGDEQKLFPVTDILEDQMISLIEDEIFYQRQETLDDMDIEKARLNRRDA
jgi:hypothetical protein